MTRTVIFGKSGSGKSWFTGQRIAEILEPDDEDDEFEYAIHVDLEDEEQGLSKKGDALLKTFEVDKETLRDQVFLGGRGPLSWADDAPDFIPEKELDSGPVVAMPKWVIYKNKSVRVVPDGLNNDEEVVLSEMMADAAMLAGDCHYSMDEAHRIASLHNNQQYLRDLITGGRKRGVEWAFITQRPALIDKTVIAQADTGVFFKLSSDRDVKKAESLAESFDAEEVLPKLPNRTAIVEDYDTGESHKIDTESLERKYEHVAGDDGKADGKWEEGGEAFGSVDEIETESAEEWPDPEDVSEEAEG